MATVFGAAFVAGAVAAFGINRALDVHLAQARPQVECEPIFVALRSLPQGSPITVWDVALRDWPKAMLPTTALRATDSFEGLLLRYPLREGQPLVAAQLVKAEDPGAAARMVSAPAWPERPAPAPAPSASELPAPATATMATATTAPLATLPPATAATGADPAASDLAPQELAASDAGESPPAALEPDSGAPQAPPVAAEEPEPAALTAVEPEPHVEPSVPTEPASGVADLPPVDAAVATVTDVVADLPPIAQPDGPTPAEPAAEDRLVNAEPGPLAAPVPALPATDIETPLASITGSRPQASPQTSSALVKGDAAPTVSPSPQPAPPLRYLVVPERIALQADASFVNSPADRGRTGQSPGSEASAPPTPLPGTASSPSRTAAPQTPAGQRRPAAPSARPAARGRTEAAPKTSGGWLPRLGFGGFGSGTTRQPPPGSATAR